MKKLFTYLLGGMLLAGACTDNVTNDGGPAVAEEGPSSRLCASMEVLQAQLAADPKLAGRMQAIEDQTRQFIENGARLDGQGNIIIPVVVNVLYRTATENISQSQIQSQIDVLNEDFNATNADLSKTPQIFQGVIGNVGIKFELSAVNRKQTSKRSWSTNDDMKRASKGGINPTDPTTKLNMWVINKMTSQGQTILGYAQFPGGSAATDGVVIGYNFFGRTGVLSAPFNKGRTATHEVGHWLNLRHIWGDATCGNDQVGDTPVHNTYNFGCPAAGHKSTCSGTPVEMTMNYMDYTDDGCMYMFTNGQKARSLAIFGADGPRAAFAQ
jgi:hypothetical protein